MCTVPNMADITTTNTTTTTITTAITTTTTTTKDAVSGNKSGPGIFVFLQKKVK